MQEKDLERINPSRSEGVCLGSLFAEHNKMKRNSYHSEFLLLLKRRNGKPRIPTRTMSLIVNNGNLCSDSTYCSESPYCDTRKIRIRGIELPTHYSEVNHRTPKAVVSYGPDIGHIPHDIRLKDLNLPLRSRNERGRNNYYLWSGSLMDRLRIYPSIYLSGYMEIDTIQGSISICIGI